MGLHRRHDSPESITTLQCRVLDRAWRPAVASRRGQTTEEPDALRRYGPARLTRCCDSALHPCVHGIRGVARGAGLDRHRIRHRRCAGRHRLSIPAVRPYWLIVWLIAAVVAAGIGGAAAVQTDADPQIRYRSAALAVRGRGDDCRSLVERQPACDSRHLDAAVRLRAHRGQSRVGAFDREYSAAHSSRWACSHWCYRTACRSRCSVPLSVGCTFSLVT